jgi:DNA phosphorothioation-dependent restriction protein DptH
VADAAVYDDIDAYRDTLHAFIFEANSDARTRLLNTDFMPLLGILRKKESSKKTSKAVPAITGMSFEVLLQGIWRTLDEFVRNCGTKPLVEQLSSIYVQLVRFDHDLTADDEGGVGAEELARELLQGCLGGLDVIFAGIDCRLPQDEDQSRMSRDQWNREVPIVLDLGLDTLIYGTSRARPNVQFKVTIASPDSDLTTESVFRWVLGPTQPERVRFGCAKKVREYWSKCSNPERLLPAFQIQSIAMTALYFAADADEANRLVTQAMTDLELVNLLEGLSSEKVDSNLWELTTSLITAYRSWLDVAVTEGYYTARKEHMSQLLFAFVNLAEKVLDTQLLGNAELLRRLYKAFLLVDERVEVNDPYLPGAIAWGLSPAVLELTQARTMFLADGFPEAIGELAIGGDGKMAFERLLDLVEIHRPLAALLVDTQQLSAEIKSFGLLHYFGPEPPTSKSLAVQTLLRDEGSDDQGVSDIVRPCEERKLVARVLSDYQQLYTFSEDGLRILAVNVRELQTVLSGLDQFLDGYLKRTSADWPPFHCTVMVYSTSSSPMAMENQLALWRNHVVERQQEKGRPLILSVGHRYAPKEHIVDLLTQEQRLYDIAFLFHFLRSGLTGYADPAMPFEYDFSGWRGLQFPITEYPRPIQDGDRYRRKSLLSNRRLRIQTCHADLSARLFHGGNSSHNHLIYGQVDYKPWTDVVETLHQRAQWVACVDPFVDKRLLCNEDGHEQRKIVGFASGLGAYGDINLTISTEQDTLKQLTDQVAGKLTKLMPFEQPDGFEAMAARVVGEAEEIIGLSSLRAVVGVDERIREVVGFAAIRRALKNPHGQMSQLLPVDSLLHWFAGSDVTMRPDLLQLTLEVRPNDIPLVYATLVECKLAQKNPGHLAKATEQIQEGLQHLTGLLAPNHSELCQLGFDRRYWWAQLHRAITSRSVVNLPDQEWRELDHALESLAEGQFEIRWQGAIFTFWTNEPGPQPEVTSLALPAGTVQPPFEVPADFVIRHLALGYQGVSALFAEVKPLPLIELNGPAIRLRPEQWPIQTSELESIPTPEPESIQTPEPELIPALEPESIQTPEPESIPTPEPESIQTPEPELIQTPEPESIPTPGSEPSPILTLVPEKILIGTRGNNDPVYWYFGHPQLANRHMLIFGASGSGKTYGIQCLLAEMAHQQLRSLIVDYTDGFLPQQIESRFAEVVSPKNHFVKTERLPLNPFRRQMQLIDPSIPAIEESPFEVATRIASIFTSVYETMGDQQTATLIRVLESGIEGSDQFSLDDILSLLREETQYGESLANKVEPLVKSRPFRDEEGSAWDEMLSSQGNWVHVLQLKGLALDIQKMVTEFVLWDLWDYAQNTGSKNRPIPIVLDEIQNLDHSSDSPIDKMLREGRKFGLSMILATQTTSQFNQEQRDRLFQAGHKLFFKPATTEIDRFAHLLTQSTTGVSKADWGQRLASLEKGQCWSLGPVLKSGGTFKEEAVLVNVTSLEQRRFEG